MTYPNERVALLSTARIFTRAARALGFDIDYRRSGFSKRASYPCLLLHRYRRSGILPIRLRLADYNGYTMVTKPTKEYTDPSGRRKIAATWTSSWPSMLWKWPNTLITLCYFPRWRFSADGGRGPAQGRMSHRRVDRAVATSMIADENAGRPTLSSSNRFRRPNHPQPRRTPAPRPPPGRSSRSR